MRAKAGAHVRFGQRDCTLSSVAAGVEFERTREVDREVKRRANVVGIFPNEASIRRLVGAFDIPRGRTFQLSRYITTQLRLLGVMSNRGERRRKRGHRRRLVRKRRLPGFAPPTTEGIDPRMDTGAVTVAAPHAPSGVKRRRMA